jgi:hypothetical protein
MMYSVNVPGDRVPHSTGPAAGPPVKLLLIIPTNMDVALFGAQRFYTNGKDCWALDGRGRRGKRILKPDWYALPLDQLLEA